jgi:signal transduction histidine kinase
MTLIAADRWQSLAVENLRFFGAMTASVSHEIRNKLAVINEKAGLLEDIAAAMRSGRAPDPDRLETQAKKIVEQIRQANRTVKALNRLAHSTDEAEAAVEVDAFVELVIELYGRRAAMAQTSVERRVSDGEVEIRTNPYLLANAIGLCLGLAVARVDDARAITVLTEHTENGARIRFRGLAGAGRDPALELETPGAAALLEVLGAELAPDDQGSELVLEIGNREHQNTGVNHD